MKIGLITQILENCNVEKLANDLITKDEYVTNVYHE